MYKQVIDWGELIQLKSKNESVANPPNVIELTDEDVDWVKKEIESVTFDQMDNLLIAINSVIEEATEMRKRLKNESEKKTKEDDMNAVFDEVGELIEQSSSNTINICRMGGMTAILELLCAHEIDEIRVKACRIFVSCT